MRFLPLLILATLHVAAASAQTPGPQQSRTPSPEAPQCTAALEGQLSCQANRMCECRFAPPVKARGLPARWAWDCSIKRPRCAVTPESLAPHPALDPDILAVEENDHADVGDRRGRRDDNDRREPPQK